MINFRTVCRRATYACSVLALALGITVISSPQAYAHRMKVFAWVDGQAIEGEVYFSGGQMATDSTVEIIANQNVIANTKTNAEGVFRFENLAVLDYDVRADAGQGHVASYTVSASEFTVDAPAVATSSQADASAANAAPPVSASVNTAQLEQAIAKAIRPLREQIDQYEAKVRMHDILGGVGYIFGVFGLFVWFRARRQ
ncbi:hypothetical protein [Photobacterium nomapromontoriensis]|uniref:hypothetical protein n=1 Tax=Photobacterium nomapromontoriensis TaxID=2910237 RepID=UPI003D0B837D